MRHPFLAAVLAVSCVSGAQAVESLSGKGIPSLEFRLDPSAPADHGELPESLSNAIASAAKQLGPTGPLQVIVRPAGVAILDASPRAGTKAAFLGASGRGRAKILTLSQDAAVRLHSRIQAGDFGGAHSALREAFDHSRGPSRGDPSASAIELAGAGKVDLRAFREEGLEAIRREFPDVTITGTKILFQDLALRAGGGRVSPRAELVLQASSDRELLPELVISYIWSVDENNKKVAFSALQGQVLAASDNSGHIILKNTLSAEQMEVAGAKLRERFPSVHFNVLKNLKSITYVASKPADVLAVIKQLETIPEADLDRTPRRPFPKGYIGDLLVGQVQDLGSGQDGRVLDLGSLRTVSKPVPAQPEPRKRSRRK